MYTGRGKVVTAKKTMQANIQLRRNEEQCGNIGKDKSNPRANALLRLEKLRMKRKAKIQDCFVRAPTPRSYKIPIPPNPPPRKVNVSTMQFLFEKRLKHSDVKEEGRIVVPKGFAEKYLPTLKSKEGIYIFMNDVVAVKSWMFRYRYWLNNASRIYVLENAGELTKAHGLQVGDFIMIYKDKESQSLAIGVRKSDAKDVELSPNAADLLPTSKDNLVPNFEDSESTSSNPKFVSISETAATCSEYGGGFQGFPFDLLHADILDLPEY